MNAVALTYACRRYKKPKVLMISKRPSQWETLLFPRCPLMVFPAVMVHPPGGERGKAWVTTMQQDEGSADCGPKKKFRPSMPCMQVWDYPGLARLLHVYVAKKQLGWNFGVRTFKFLPERSKPQSPLLFPFLPRVRWEAGCLSRFFVPTVEAQPAAVILAQRLRKETVGFCSKVTKHT